MSHYSNHHLKRHGLKTNIQERLTERQCWGCGADIVVDKHNRHRPPKICDDCKTLPTDQIKKIYGKHYTHSRDMYSSRDDVILPCEERFIFNSPFRTKQ